MKSNHSNKLAQYCLQSSSCSSKFCIIGSNDWTGSVIQAINWNVSGQAAGQVGGRADRQAAGLGAGLGAGQAAGKAAGLGAGRGAGQVAGQGAWVFDRAVNM